MKIDTSNELQICRFNNGIKLSRLKKSSSQNTVGNIFNLPFIVFLNSVDHRIIKINVTGADLNGYISAHDAINKKWYTTYKKNMFASLMHDQEDVLKNNKFIITEDTTVRRDESKINALTIKMPWYNEENKIIGVFGCSIPIDNHSIVQKLKMINQLAFLNMPNPISEMPTLATLSKRQLECLKHLVRGKTAREIAAALSLSTRTIEHYLDDIKLQLHVSSKSELIDKVFDWFK